MKHEGKLRKKKDDCELESFCYWLGKGNGGCSGKGLLVFKEKRDVEGLLGMIIIEEKPHHDN